MRQFIFGLALFFIAPVQAQSTRSFQTVCNLRYNNYGVIHSDVPCRAQFVNRRLRSVSLVFPSNKVRYNWIVGQPDVTADPRWDECMRHTNTNGNQWQVCTVPSPSELGL